MATTPEAMKAELDALVRGTGQEHVLQYWGELSTELQTSLYLQFKQDILPTIPATAAAAEGGATTSPLDFYNKIFEESMKSLEISVSGVAPIIPPTAADVTDMTASATALQDKDAQLRLAALSQTGKKCINNGECAVVVLAGGAGTRLGQSYPKGMLVCPLLAQQKSLFQLHCEKVKRMEVLAGAAEGTLHICFMTSEQTDKDTREFFAQHNNFGLKDSQVHYTVQSAIPCFTLNGKIVLAEKHKIATAPGGNAGIYEALSRGNVLSKFKAAGVKYVQIFTVDNILAKIGQPEFYGMAVESKADVLVKSCPKASDHEAVGVFACRDGKWGVVEYSELGKEQAEEKDEVTGQRKLNCANIAIHLTTLSFLETAAKVMETFTYYHVAKKPIATAVTNAVQETDPATGKVQGVKLEAFIFDLFQFGSGFQILQVDRTEEFSAIKNADDPNKKDSPTTAVKDLQRQHFRWMLAAAEKISEDVGLDKVDTAALKSLVSSGETDGIVEISPLMSYGGENLNEHCTAFVERLQQEIEWKKKNTAENRPAVVLLKGLTEVGKAKI